MRKQLASQIEADLQARIKKLEEDNQALFVAIANVVASEQAANWENSRLVSNQTSYKTTLREYCDAGISKLNGLEPYSCA